MKIGSLFTGYALARLMVYQAAHPLLAQPELTDADMPGWEG